MNLNHTKTIYHFLRACTVGQILTAKEVAKYLNLTEITIYKYDKEGKIPARRIGSRWRFDKDKIDELLGSKEEEKRKE